MKKFLFLLIFLCSVVLYSQDFQRFEKVENEAINSENADFGIVFYKNDMVLFASSKKDVDTKKRHRKNNRMGFLRFYKALIGDQGELVLIDKFSFERYNMFHESDITFTPDGRTIFFTLNNYIDTDEANKFERSSDKLDILNIFRATVDDAGIATNIAPVPFNSEEHSVRYPHVSPDGKTLFFASDDENGYGGLDLYKVALLEDGAYGVPENLGPTINTKGNELFPFLSTNNEFYFTSDGHPNGVGYLDVYGAKYDGQGFSDLNNLKVLNSEYDDFALAVSPEKGVGYFSSSRKGVGDADIFSFRMKPIDCNQTIVGVVRDITTDEPLENARVELMVDGVTVDTTITTIDGAYSFKIDCEKTYNVVVTTDTHETATNIVRSDNTNSATIISDFMLTPVYCNQFIVGTVVSQETKIPLIGVEVQLSYNNEVIETVTTGIGGEYNFTTDLNCESSYEVKAEFENYLPAFENVTTGTVINAVINKDLFLKEFQDFVTIRNVKMIRTNPILFDLNSAKIRRDAAIELDNVVKILEENPNIKLEINSHTDSRAPDAYNMRLSEERSKSTIAYIVSRGIDASRLSGQGFGETQLVNKCSNGVKCSEAEHQANRRTEFIVINE
ncbi:hypothetical protein KH5_24530 [Urechidicola sp. KH5]